MSIIYLSGPMTGLPDFNYPAFHAAAASLRRDGHTVYNPAEYEWDGDTFPVRQAFAEYCTFICDCADTIALLPGWDKSPGASAEHALAKVCGLRVVAL